MMDIHTRIAELNERIREAQARTRQARSTMDLKSYLRNATELADLRAERVALRAHLIADSRLEKRIES